MKGTTTFFLTPLVIGLAVSVFGLSSFSYEKFSAWQWCLAAVAVLLVGLALSAVLNFAVFGPVYWLVGRLHSKRLETPSSHEHKT